MEEEFCRFMQKLERFNPNCPTCNTWIVFCRNPKCSVFGAKLTSRQCCKESCRFYVAPDEIYK